MTISQPSTTLLPHIPSDREDALYCLPRQRFYSSHGT